MSLPSQVASSVNVLAALLNEIGAAEFLQVFIDDDRDDDSIKTLANFSVEKIATKFGLPLDVASAFSDKCRSKFISPALPVTRTPVDDVAIMRSLNLEIVRELGQGGFGIVYEAKNLVDKLRVAVKIVKDPQNAAQAVREGQRLRRVKHKHIVSMHKVHDLGDGSCALEMEVVPGGDLSQHLDACRRRPHARLPHGAALRFSRQLLEALVYLHDELKWLHGDIKPQNILMQCNPVPADGSDVDYGSAEIKLADFGLSKILDQQNSTPSLVLSTMVGTLKGTMWYLSPEAFSGMSSGYERCVADDLWSACLVIFEMDTGLGIQQLMTAPGCANIEVLLTKSSPDLLPLLCCVLLAQSKGSRCSSAAELLHMLGASTDPLFVWQFFDPDSQHYVSVPPASFVALEGAFVANESFCVLPLPPPLDLVFDIGKLLSSSVELGFQTEKRSKKRYSIRRVLKPFLSSSQSIPTWQELVDGKEWLQCSPALCAKLDVEVRNPNGVIDPARYRQLALDSGSISDVQLPHPLKIEPYLAPAHADDIAMLNMRVHDSLPEWDVTAMEQVTNATLASKYAAYRHRVASHCNGNPNERVMFHFAHPAVMTKIWQDGEGHDPRLSYWAEVGKGAYFSKHLMYGYAYKYGLWPSPPEFEVKAEPPIGETMLVFASLVCLGNVADMGPGCETCPSPAWDAWKNEAGFARLPKPTRPPAVTLSADAAEKQHILDLTQVKDAPRYDSVKSTEGDLGTHPSSTNKDTSGRLMCDIMHPRLRTRAKEWAEQYVLFDAAASYPMFIVTLTKTRDSPIGPQALVDAGCDANRIKALGFTASHIMALGKSARDMRNADWSVSELKDAGFDLRTLFEANCKLSDLRSAGFNVRQFIDSGFDLPNLIEVWSIPELKDAGFDLRALFEANCKLSDLRSAGFNVRQFIDSGFDLPNLQKAGFMPGDLLPEGFNIPSLLKLYTLKDMKTSNVKVRDLKAAGLTCEALFVQGKFTEKDLREGGFLQHELECVLSPLRLRRLGYTAEKLEELGYTPIDIENAGYLNLIHFFLASAAIAGYVGNLLDCERKMSALNIFYAFLLGKMSVAGFSVFGFFLSSNSDLANIGLWLGLWGGAAALVFLILQDCAKTLITARLTTLIIFTPPFIL